MARMLQLRTDLEDLLEAQETREPCDGLAHPRRPLPMAQKGVGAPLAQLALWITVGQIGRPIFGGRSA
jgi:hypothetical protein